MAAAKSEFLNALSNVVSEQFAVIPREDEIKDMISVRFDRRMKKLVKQQKRFYWVFINTTAKRAAVLLLIILLLLISGLSVSAIRDPALRVIKEIYDTYIKYSFTEETVDSIKKEYAVHFIPEGFYQTNRQTDTTSFVMWEFSNEKNEVFTFAQRVLKGADLFVDNEGVTSETVKIGPITGDYYEKKGSKVLIWTTDDYVFVLSTLADINKETMIKIAESVS